MQASGLKVCLKSIPALRNKDLIIDLRVIRYGRSGMKFAYLVLAYLVLAYLVLFCLLSRICFGMQSRAMRDTQPF